MKIHHSSSENVIAEILDLGHLCHGEEDAQKVLNLLTEKISKIMQSDVCSIYLLDSTKKELVLKATKGLNASAIDRVKMQVGEGLVGKTLEWLKPVSMPIGRNNKSFKFFPETGEDKYSSFLGVPLIYNRHPIGVLVVQNEETTQYESRAVHLLLTLAIPAVSVIEKVKLSGTFGQISKEGEDLKGRWAGLSGNKRLQSAMHEGVGASPGIAVAPVKIVKRITKLPVISKNQEPIHVEVEKMRMLEAFRWVEEEIREVEKKVSKRFGSEELSIFDAYRMVLESEPFKDQIIEKIEAGYSALEGVELVIRRYTEELTAAADDYIRERAYDIQDVGRKVTDRLLYGSDVPKSHSVLESDAILLSEFWSISDFVEIDLEKTKGIISPTGGSSSHVAILAESLGLPTVLGLSSFADNIREGDVVIMDGSSGTIVVNPSEDVLKAYHRESEHDVEIREIYRRSAFQKAIPKRGKRIAIAANLGIISDVPQALENGAEEVGLYRTEFPFLIRRSLPTEEEQFVLYCKILQKMGNKPVTIRTLDIGGDKYLPYLNLPHEENPFLGWRSIRISLEREDLFRIQLRALLRASMCGKLRLLFPMITSMEEIKRIKEILTDVKKELKSQGIKFRSSIPLGIMIEVPSAVEMADAFIKEVQFFSIGTNDLTQYTLAVDRNNTKVAKLFNPLHPAVLRSISRTIKVAHKAKKQVTVCGEMASQPLGVILLLGMDIDCLSMSTPLISKIKNFITKLDYYEVKKFTNHILKVESTTEIIMEAEQFLRKRNLEEFLPHPNVLVKIN